MVKFKIKAKENIGNIKAIAANRSATTNCGLQAIAINKIATFATLSILPLLFGSKVLAQIVPDGTLPNNTRVLPADNASAISNIDGGTALGGNLLHSFQEFSVPTGSSAFFNNALNIENIIARVTGGLPSNIDGLIRANGSANLFLLNPAGIMFGPQARLDIGGSLVASSANSIIFNDGSSFSAKNPSEIPLLTINVPIGLQVGENSGEIRVAGTGLASGLPVENIGLAVAPGKTIALVGGDVTLTGATVAAPSGRIEIGSVDEGEVTLSFLGDGGWGLGYEGISEFGEIQFREQSLLSNPNQSNNPSGGIAVSGGNITLDRSQIVATNLGAPRGYDIALDASESIEIGGAVQSRFALSSSVTNQVEEGASGSGGSIALDARELTIRDGGRIQTRSFGSGAAGQVTVNASEILISGFSPLGLLNFQFEESPNSRIVSENYGIGAGGDVRVTASELTLLDGGQVGTLIGPNATGNGGFVTVVSPDITGFKGNPLNTFLPSGIVTTNLGAGDGGDIAISTERLTLQEGSRIQSFGQGTGIGGDIAVNATESISGVPNELGADIAVNTTESISGDESNSVIPVFPFGIASLTAGPASGGSVELSTDRLVLNAGAVIGSFVIIFQGSQQPSQGAAPGAALGAGLGNAGDVTVIARSSVDLSGANPLAPDNLSGVISSTFSSGNAGNVSLSTKRLTVRNGASISSVVNPPESSFEQAQPEGRTGLGGDVTIDVSEFISVFGINPFLAIPSFVGTLTAGSGNAGSTIINAPRLFVLDGGLVGSTTINRGNAGRITINSSDSIIVSGGDPNSGNFSQVSARTSIIEQSLRENLLLPSVPSGDTGEVTINTNRLEVLEGGTINVEHSGTGNAGQLQLNAGDIVLDGGSITASTVSGLGGNATLNINESLQLREGSRITVEALGGDGDGGNLIVNSPVIAALENSQITANAFGGRGGNIQIDASGIFLSADSPVTASSQLGVDGIVEINTPEFEPSSGLLGLPQNFVDPSKQIVTGCAADEGNEFTIAGRGGLPPNPRARLQRQLLWEDLRSMSELRKNYPSLGNNSWEREGGIQADRKPLVEATGWVRDSSGQLWLVAVEDETHIQELQGHPNCGDLKSEEL
ncbi:MAG: filamentous hemagglutinin N-terminal domain-containing protein [Oscillatoria sp. SIO1A7]|nr:filamentous hemagglutinin N-terminal domain-containing protein [Oscillatoria sp. SIO1A7]